MARPLIPFVQNGYYASRNWIPLVKGNGFTTSGGGEQEEVWETASGSIVTFDAVAAPLRQLSVSVEPVQNLNGYDNPWPAGGGKNLLPENLFVGGTSGGVTSSLNNNGTINLSASSMQAAVRIDIGSVTLDAGTYTLTGVKYSDSTGIELRLRTNISQGSTEIAVCNSRNPSVNFTLAETTTIYAVFIALASFGGKSGTYSPMIRLSSIADATFAPYSNICPITGRDSVTVNRTGVNWYPVSIGADYWTNFNNGSSSNNNGELIVSMAAQMYSGVYSRSDAQIRKLSKYSVTASYSVNIKASVATEIFMGYAQKGNRKVQLTTEYQRFTFENFAFGTDNSFNIYNGTANAVTVYLKDFQFELGSTATSYEPYSGNEYTIQLGETVYGGTLDVVNGKMTVDRAMVTFSTAAGLNRNSARQYYITSTYTPGIRTPSAIEASILSNQFKPSASASTDGVVFLNTTGNIRFNTTADYASASEMIAALGALEIVYPLATPFELTLTPEQIATLQGTNNVWSDAGDVTVEYRVQ